MGGGAAPVSRQATPTELPGASAVTVIYPANILAVVPGDTLIASDRMAVQTLDLEGTVSFCLNQTELTGAAGLRPMALTLPLLVGDREGVFGF